MEKAKELVVSRWGCAPFALRGPWSQLSGLCGSQISSPRAGLVRSGASPHGVALVQRHGGGGRRLVLG